MRMYVCKTADFASTDDIEKLQQFNLMETHLLLSAYCARSPSGLSCTG